MNRLRYVLLGSETVATRFWMGLVSIGFGTFCTQIDGHWEYEVATHILPPWAWTAYFCVYGTALLLGVFTQRHSPILLGVKLMGAFIWTAMGITTTLAQHVPGATLLGAMIAMWIVVRYPTWK